MWCIPTMAYYSVIRNEIFIYAVTRMDPEHIKLSEIARHRADIV